MSDEAYLAGEPVVVTAALTGGVHGKETSPHVPETPAEVGAAAAEAEAAGASVVHLHARRDNGERAFSTERFQELTDAVREHTESVVEVAETLGRPVATPAQTRELLNLPDRSR